MLSLRHLCLFLSLCGSVAGAQTLAHPGWRGNGIASEAWWKHAIFVRFHPGATFATITGTMDAMAEAGADSMILPDLQPTVPAQPDAEGTTRPFDRQFGTEDDLDALLREASARRMHVLLRANLLRLAGNPGEVRFWMSRGIAGFDVGGVTRAEMDTLSLLRGAMDRFPGRRILLAHVPDTANPADRRQDPVTLHLLSPDEASSQHGSLPNAVEVQTVGGLKVPLPPGTPLVVDASLLSDKDGREALRQAMDIRRAPHPPTRSSRRRSR